jgi:hypothetical protein
MAVIDNPILNSPFREPTRHFKFDAEGITDEILTGRRPSSHFVPIPRAKKKGKQLAYWTREEREVRGVDVYDPTTGQIRSSSTDDIACWFIDTDYNGESFFVRHAYFTGGDEPYEKLKRALRAEIDEGAWSTLYSTVSPPFAPPETGKIAVKVINHYGDEVLKVFTI